MTNQAPATASNVFKNIIALLNGALHPGAHAAYVAQSVAFLEQLAAAEDAKEAQAATLTTNDVSAIAKAQAKRAKKAAKNAEVK